MSRRSSLWDLQRRVWNRLRLRSELRKIWNQHRLRPIFEHLESRRVLATVTWDGGAGTFSWNDANNWDTNTLPTAADDAVIPDLTGTPTITLPTSTSVLSVTSAEKLSLTGAITLTVAASSSFNNGLNLSGGTLTTNAVATLNGSSSWTGATISGTGTLSNLGTLSIASGNVAINSGATFSNSGTVQHATTGSMTINGFFTNELAGIYNVTANTGTIGVSGGATSRALNLGTLRRTTGTGAFNFSSSIVGTPTFENDGTVEIQTGSATWTGASAATHNGSFALSSGTSITFSSGTQTFGTGASITGSGTANFGTGTINISDDVSFSSFVLAGATTSITSGKTLTVSGSNLAWNTSGSIGGAGTFSIAPGSTFTYNPNGAGVSLAASLVNNGTFVVSSAGVLNMTGSFTNAGTMQIQNATGTFSNGGTVTNTGTIQKLTNTGSITIISAFNNSGTIDVQAGTFALNGAITLTGGTYNVTGTALTFNSNATWSGTLTGSGTGTISQTTGTVTIAGGGATLNFPNNYFRWVGGAVNGGTLTNQSFVTFDPSGGGVLTFGANFANQGTFQQISNGAFNLNTGVTFNNTGTLLIGNASGTISNGPGNITNSGTIRRTTNTAIATIIAPLNNTGTIDVQAGSLTFSGTSTLTGGTYIVTGTALNMSGNATWSGTLTGSGSGSFNQTTGTVTVSAPGATLDFTAGNMRWVAGAVNGSPLTNLAGSTIKFDPAGNTFAINNSFNNAGTFEMISSGAFNPGATGSFNNSGTLLLSGGANTISNGAGTINNTGTISKTATGSMTIITPLTNSGTLQIAAGSLTLPGGNTHTGTFDTAAGTTLTFGTGTTSFGAGTAFTGTGTISTSATMSFVDNVTLSSLTTSSGTITTAAGKTLTVTGTSSLTGTTISANSTLRNTGTLTINSTGSTISGTLRNAGTINHATVLNTTINTGGSIINEAGSTYAFTANSGISASQIIGTGSFNNQGTILKNTGPTNNAVIAIPFTNSGLVDARVGITRFSSTGTHTGTFDVASGATIDFQSNQTITSTAVMTGSGTFSVSGSGTLSVDGTRTITNLSVSSTVAPSGDLSVSGTTSLSGNIGGTGRLIATGQLGFVNATVNSGATLRNEGTGLIDATDNLVVTGTLQNSGTLTLQRTGSANNVIQGTGTFTNLPGGIIENNSSVIGGIDMVVNNQGIARALQGTLRFTQNPSQLVGSTLTGGTWVVQGGTIDFNVGSNIATIGSAATVTFNGATGSFPKVNTVNNIQGTLNLVNRTFTGTASVGVVNSGTISVDGGAYAQTTATTFTQSGGSLTLSNGATFGTAVTINGGTVSGSGTFTGASLTNAGGTIAPGASPGKLIISGNYVQSAGGTLQIEIGGTNATTPDFDQLIVTGTVTLDGTLNVTLINGFVPSLFNSFRFIDNGSGSAVSGSFSGLSQGSVLTLSGRDLQINYGGGTGNDVVLTDVTGYRVWDGGAGNLNWNDPNNWSPNTTPTATDDVFLDLPGDSTVSITAPTSIRSLTTSDSVSVASTLTTSAPSTIGGSLTLVGGTLQGTSDTTVTGLILLRGGAISTTGTVNALGGVSFDGTYPSSFIGQATLNLSGTSTVLGPNTALHGNSAVINVLPGAVLDFQNDVSLLRATAANSTLNNQGTLRKSGGTGSTTVQLALNSSGTIEASSGTLAIQDGTSSGAAVVSAGSTLTASSYVFDSSSSVTGSGTMNLVSTTVGGVYNITGTTNLYSIGNSFGSSANVQSVGTSVTINGGAVAFNSGEAISTDTFAINSSTLTGADNITVSGLTSLNSSNLSTTGTFNANGGMAINTGGGPGFIGKVTLNLSGNSTMSGPHSMGHGDNSVINILSGATLSIDDNMNFNRVTPADSTLNNQGTLRKITGTGSSTFDIILNNTGSIVVSSGSLSIRSGTSSGSASVSAPASLTASSYAFTSTSSVSGSGTMNLVTTTVDGVYNITGTTNLYSIGNSFSSSANVQSVGTSVTINGGAVAFNSGEAISTDTFAINSSTLTGADNITVSGLTSLNSSSLSTTGTFNANGGMAINTGGGPGFIGKVTLNLSGNSTMSGPHSMGHGDNAVINILSGATLSIDDINFTESHLPIRRSIIKVRCERLLVPAVRTLTLFLTTQVASLSLAVA